MGRTPSNDIGTLRCGLGSCSPLQCSIQVGRLDADKLEQVLEIVGQILGFVPSSLSFANQALRAVSRIAKLIPASDETGCRRLERRFSPEPSFSVDSS